MKRLWKILVVALPCLCLAGAGLSAMVRHDYPPLKDGDLIFQTLSGQQSAAIIAATENPYSHVGIIKNDGKTIMVVEAAGPVRETPLAEWIDRGLLRRFAIYRDPALTPEQAAEIVALAETYQGRPYDYFFSFDNETLYCSELPYLAYKSIGINIGRVQKIAELNIENELALALIKQRWRDHPACKAKISDFETCYKVILGQSLVTPASLAQDQQFEKIFSNYP